MSKRNDEIIEMILNYGTTDGGHHKMWILDQVLRLATGDRYEEVIKSYECDGEYEWDVGIAP